MPPKTRHLFWERIEKLADGCWIWKGAVSSNGYGRYWDGVRGWRAHRRAWFMMNGEIDAGMDVCHRCDNRLCVNPDHLFLGTRKDNMSDCVQKGRIATGARNGASKRVFARDTNPSAKITEAEIPRIKMLRDDGLTHQQIAERMGVDRRTIGRILERL